MDLCSMVNSVWAANNKVRWYTVCVCVCVRVCSAHVCVCACVCVCMCVCVKCTTQV